MNTHTQSFLCPVCGSSHVQGFVNILHVPVHCNLLWSDRAAARSAPMGDIELAFCRTCGHIFNVAFDPAQMEYTQAYENSLHFSPRFQSYAEELARDLVARHNLYGKEIVETGAGQGDFLRLLCTLGGNRGWGFDTAYAPEAPQPGDELLTFVQDFDWWKYVARAPDLFYTRHVLEHIEAPRPFLQTIRDKIGARPDTLVFFEVPNMAYTLRAHAIWDIIYEHCGYYSPQSLACLFARTGFTVLQTRATYAGQFLTIEARPAEAPDDAGCPSAAALALLAAQVETFADVFRAKVDEWRQKLDAWQEAGQKVVAWGSGSKGNTFLNVLNTQGQIEYIVDINPRKVGKFVVGTGQEIVHPDFLRAYRPDVVILMNPIYREEIGRTVAAMGLQVEFHVA